MKLETLYPLRFTPILKSKVWGGNKLHALLGKEAVEGKIGESWEISDVEKDFSIVDNGNLKGRTLKNLILDYQEKLVGKTVFKEYQYNFPLLIKFIDAKENLSVQVHPGDDLAEERHQSYGKTEMWYVMQADDNANIISGFKKGITKEEYLTHLENETLESVLNKELVKNGDTFFIKPGLVHAIGAGVVLAEIQQTSDITYRIFDWNRKDDHGEKRELHTAMALDAIDYNNNNDYLINYTTQVNQLSPLVFCTYFKTKIIQLLEASDFKLLVKEDSFVILIGVEGEAIVHYNDTSEKIKMGETLLIPASLQEISIDSKNSKLLHVTM